MPLCIFLLLLCPRFRFCFRVPATPDTYTLSLHDALPISSVVRLRDSLALDPAVLPAFGHDGAHGGHLSLVAAAFVAEGRSEEHTSELQSRSDLVCRLLLEKKKCHVRFSLFIRFVAGAALS